MELKVNSGEVKKLVNSSETADNVLRRLAKMMRRRKQTDVTRLKSILSKEGISIDNKEYHSLWKNLEAMGAGSYIIGRKGNPNRFRSNYSLKDIARIAVGDKVPEVKETRNRGAGAKRGRPKGSKNKVKLFSNVFITNLLNVQLRDNFIAQMTIPADLSKSEAQVLCQAITERF